MSLTPTQEQAEIVQECLLGKDVRVKAFAGAAKSSTLVMIAEAFEKRGGAVGMYLAFNKAIANEAQEKFPVSVECRTVHSLAYKYTPSDLRKKLNYEKIISKQFSEIYGFKQSFLVDKENNQRFMSIGSKWTMVTRTVAAYCNSADSDLKMSHVGLLDWMYAKHNYDLESLKEEVLELSKRYWNDIIDPNSKVPLSHDAYLKLFSEKGRDLPVTYIMIDENQDSSPVILKLISKLGCQKIYVGDDYQQIYGWRGAVNAMDMVEGQEKFLTKSFRFGNNVEKLANTLLKFSGCEVKLFGNGSDVGKTYAVAPDGWEPNAVICRTNSGVVKNIFKYAEKYPNKSIGASFDAQAIYKFVNAYIDVCSGKETYHPLLIAFNTKEEILEYCEDNPDDVEIVNIVDMIERFGASTLLNVVKRCESNKKPELMITTAHKSKGLEWDNVRVADDFRVIGKEGLSTTQEEVNLLYVTLTRAKKDLDVGGVLLGLDLIAGQVGDTLDFVTPENAEMLQKELIQTFKKSGIPVGIKMASMDALTSDEDIYRLFNEVVKDKSHFYEDLDV